MHPALALVLSYLSGSIPSAWLAGKWSGVNLRDHGSGNLGATNVVRVLGPRIGTAVFLVDIAKGALPVYFLARMTGLEGNSLAFIQVGCGAAAIFGHARPAFLGFSKGGKGVATACGVFIALVPLQTFAAFLTFTTVVLASGYVSLASLSAAVAFPVYLGVSLGLMSMLLPVGVVAALFVVWTHRENIKRLRAGSEFRFERSAKLGLAPSIAIGVLFAAVAVTLMILGAPQ